MINQPLSINFKSKEFKINPSLSDSETSEIDLIVSSLESQNILMMEGVAKRPIKTNLLAELSKKCAESASINAAEFSKFIDANKNRLPDAFEKFLSDEDEASAQKLFSELFYAEDAIFSKMFVSALEKPQFLKFLNDFKECAKTEFFTKFSKKPQIISNFDSLFGSFLRKTFAQSLRAEQQRIDGRNFDEIRKICVINYFI